MSWLYGELLMELKHRKTGEVKIVKWQEGWSDEWFALSPQPFVEVDVVGWTDQRDQAQIEAFVRSITELQDSNTMEILAIEDGDVDVPAAGPEDGQPRQITQKVDAPALVIPRREPEPVAVQAPTPEPAPVAAPAPVQASAPVPAPAPVAAVEGADPAEIARLQAECQAAEKPLPPSDLAWARSVAKLAPGVDATAIGDTRILGRYLRALKEAFGGVL
jgi:hypothetical protein